MPHRSLESGLHSCLDFLSTLFQCIRFYSILFDSIRFYFFLHSFWFVLGSLLASSPYQLPFPILGSCPLGRPPCVSHVPARKKGRGRCSVWPSRHSLLFSQRLPSLSSSLSLLHKKAQPTLSQDKHAYDEGAILAWYVGRYFFACSLFAQSPFLPRFTVP